MAFQHGETKSMDQRELFNVYSDMLKDKKKKTSF